MKRFFAANNYYASDGSPYGFANTWYVLAFDSRKARDTYVKTAPYFAVRAIMKKEIGKYIDRPDPFSMEHWGIVNNDYHEVEIDGFLGVVECVHEFDARGTSYKGRVYS